MDEYFKVQSIKAMVQIRMEHNKGVPKGENMIYIYRHIIA